MAEKPLYYVTKTLLDSSGGPDINKRTLCKSGREEPICPFNQNMCEWTIEDQRLVNIIVEALNAHATALGPVLGSES